VYRHARYMPKKYARTWVQITDVRVQKVQAISEEDAIAEGIQKFTYGEEYGEGFISHGYWTERLALGAMPVTARLGFARLWDSIHGPGAWERDDWVFAISFELVEKETAK